MLLEWYLVFWLQMPENYTVYADYAKERDCRDAEYVWNRRLRAVHSSLQAECRRRPQ